MIEVEKNDFKVVRISDHKAGHAGKLCVLSASERGLRSGIDQVLVMYPKFPYGTKIGPVMKDENGVPFCVFVEHWGSD